MHILCYLFQFLLKFKFLSEKRYFFGSKCDSGYDIFNISPFVDKILFLKKIDTKLILERYVYSSSILKRIQMFDDELFQKIYNS